MAEKKNNRVTRFKDRIITDIEAEIEKLNNSRRLHEADANKNSAMAHILSAQIATIKKACDVEMEGEALDEAGS